jgi:hypothetical protein
MKIAQPLFIRFVALLSFTALLCAAASAQYEGELNAKRRVFAEAGPGVRTIKRMGDRTYVLSSQGLTVFEKEKKIAVINTSAPPPAPIAGPKSVTETIAFVEDFDVDSSGKIYVADRATNQIVVYSVEGTRTRSFPVDSPISVAALSDGEVAVATLRDSRLIHVFDKNGRDVRDFGELEDISDRPEMNRYLNAGYLATDGAGMVYYGFIFAPEPTVRAYDRVGFATQTIQFSELESFAAAQAARKEIERQEKRGKQPIFKPQITAIGIARPSGLLWLGLHSRLLRFDKEGNRRATYQLYTPDGLRLEANSIIVDNDHIYVAGSTLGVFEFDRPDPKNEDQPKD